MACSEELSDFQRGTIIACHLSNKSVCHISILLEMPRSTVSAVIVKWKCLGAATSQLRSSSPNKLPEQDRHVLKRVKIVCPQFRVLYCLLKQHQHNNCLNFMKWVSMAEQPHTSLRSPCALPSVGWCGVSSAPLESGAVETPSQE